MFSLCLQNSHVIIKHTSALFNVFQSFKTPGTIKNQKFYFILFYYILLGRAKSLPTSSCKFSILIFLYHMLGCTPTHYRVGVGSFQHGSQWPSSPSFIPSPWVSVGSNELILTKRIWQKWRDTTSVVRSWSVTSILPTDSLWLFC